MLESGLGERVKMAWLQPCFGGFGALHELVAERLDANTRLDGCRPQCCPSKSVRNRATGCFSSCACSCLFLSHSSHFFDLVGRRLNMRIALFIKVPLDSSWPFFALGFRSRPGRSISGLRYSFLRMPLTRQPGRHRAGRRAWHSKAGARRRCQHVALSAPRGQWPEQAMNCERLLSYHEGFSQKNINLWE